MAEKAKEANKFIRDTFARNMEEATPNWLQREADESFTSMTPLVDLCSLYQASGKPNQVLLITDDESLREKATMAKVAFCGLGKFLDQLSVVAGEKNCHVFVEWTGKDALLYTRKI